MAEVSSKKVRVVHLTSVHPRYDTRIFVKQCRTLASHGFDVSLIVADSLPNEEKDGVKVISVGAPQGRIDRMRQTTKKVLDKAVALDADVYHLHDPELLPSALTLKRFGKKVIFDSHEDVPKQILGKKYIPAFLRPYVARVVAVYEKRICSRLDGVVCATPFIREKFLQFNKNSVDVNNYPSLEEFAEAVGGTRAVVNQVCYVGVISRVRGAREMVRAMELVPADIRLALGGKFQDEKLRSEVMAYPGWRSVVELGWVSRSQIPSVFAGSFAGLVALHPIVNYVDALPVKMFEYMGAGLPVIASDFPLLKEIVNSADCGICVNPLDARAIADAVAFLNANPARGREMGANGRKAVLERYNWSIEAAKLLVFYKDLLGR